MVQFWSQYVAFKTVPVVMDKKIDVGPIVEPGSFGLFVTGVEAEWFD